MAVILLPEDHNDTTECFKRHSKVFFSDQFLSEPSADARWYRRCTQFLAVYLVLLFLAFWLIPTQAIKPPAPPPVKHAQLLPNFQTQLKALKACAVGTLPVWLDKTTIQCLKEMP